jgi:hypothetical protein
MEPLGKFWIVLMNVGGDLDSQPIFFVDIENMECNHISQYMLKFPFLGTQGVEIIVVEPLHQNVDGFVDTVQQKLIILIIVEESLDNT